MIATASAFAEALAVASHHDIPQPRFQLIVVAFLRDIPRPRP
ncbi:MAG: hypothetical protein QM820_08555 [Minicystis sp.]